MKLWKRQIVLAALVSLALLLPLPTLAGAGRGESGGARLLRVGAGGDFAALDQALATARAGDSLELLPGVQTGRWVIRQSLTLRGAAGAILDGGGQGTLLTIAAPDVTVQGLIIRNSGRSLLNDDAAILVVAAGSRARIIGNRLEDIHHAVYVKEGAAGTLIRGNSIAGRSELIAEDRGNGIHLWNAPDSRVEGNTVSGVRDGVYVGFAPRSVFRDNSFDHVRYGIHFMYADDNTFERNRFSHSEAGAALMYSKRITLRQNIFSHSRSSRAYGLLLQECDGVVAEDNLLVDNSRGLFLNVSRDSRFTGNLFLANDLAVQSFDASTGNLFQGNDFVANMRLVEMQGADHNTWRGNYWDAYRGLDLDGDGLGDLPFRTRDPLGVLTTDEPQLRLFRYSPSVQALETAEQVFPLMELPEIRDEHPALRPLAQASGRLPALPVSPSLAGGSRLWLALLGLVLLAAGLAIAWSGGCLRPVQLGLHTPSAECSASPCLRGEKLLAHCGAAFRRRVSNDRV